MIDKDHIFITFVGSGNNWKTVAIPRKNLGNIVVWRGEDVAQYTIKRGSMEVGNFNSRETKLVTDAKDPSIGYRIVREDGDSEYGSER